MNNDDDVGRIMTQQDFEGSVTCAGGSVEHRDVMAWARNAHIDQRPPDERIASAIKTIRTCSDVSCSANIVFSIPRLVIYCGVFGAWMGGSSRTLKFIDSFAATRIARCMIIRGRG